MTAPVAGLTLSFVQHRAAEAARVLNDLEPEETAAFLASIPSRLGAPLLARMEPGQAARALGLQPPELAAAMVRAMRHLDSVTVVRLLSDEAREALYAQLPRRIVNDVARSLEYPVDTVGAWMDLAIAALQGSSTVGEARRHVRRRPDTSLQHLFVTGPGRQLQGAVSMAQLIRADERSALVDAMDIKVTALSNRALLGEVARLSTWDQLSILPVVGRKGNVLGALSRADLRRGLAAVRETDGPVMRARLSYHVLDAWLAAASGLFRALLGRQAS